MNTESDLRDEVKDEVNLQLSSSFFLFIIMLMLKAITLTKTNDTLT
jgi:hypothetical protein